MIEQEGEIETGAESFLQRIANASLDPDYEIYTARHRADPVRNRIRFIGVRTFGLVLVGAIVSLSFTAAIADNSRRAPNASAARASLIRQIDTAVNESDSVSLTNRRLRETVNALQQDAFRLGSEGSTTGGELERLTALAGESKVRGEGIVITLVASVIANPVFDTDLQTLVNLLWLSGAEAIAIGGERLTSLSAIRSAGSAILVDYRPISGPYVIYAVGPKRSLSSALATGVGESFVRELTDAFGIQVRVQKRNSITLPASQTSVVRINSKVFP